MQFFRSCFRERGSPNGEDFYPQTRRFSAAILGGLQGEATQYTDKKTAQAVCNAYENGFSGRNEMKEKGWRPFWAALLAALLVLLPLVGGEHVHMDDAVTLDAGCAVDLGGIAKGYASQQVADILRAHGVTSAVVSLGGNVYVCGSKPDGTPWNVGIQDPAGSGYAAMVSLTDRFAVTSGGYQRYFEAEDGTVYRHILDPRTGCPADSDLLSVTIISDDGTAADAYSTALYVMGEQEAVSFWRAHGGFELILITADGRLLYTPGLSDAITKPEDCAYDFQLLTAQPAA